MTNKEALIRLECEAVDLTGALAEKPNKPLEIILDAINTAIEALEKQIPKTPNYEGDGYWNGELIYDTWICPNCGKDYEVDYDNYKHCPECGQAIDRSDEE